MAIIRVTRELIIEGQDHAVDKHLSQCWMLEGVHEYPNGHIIQRHRVISREIIEPTEQEITRLRNEIDELKRRLNDYETAKSAEVPRGTGSEFPLLE